MPVLKIETSGGFFANCLQKLYKIISYSEKNGKYPKEIDTFLHFKKYNPEFGIHDITFDFFKNPKEIENLKFNKKEPIKEKWGKNIKYRTLNFKKGSGLPGVLDKFFTPSDSIIQLCNEIMHNYGIDFSEFTEKRYCGVYYRGTDKGKETKLAPYGEYTKKMDNIKEDCPEIVFILQTDDGRFLEYAVKHCETKGYEFIVFRENETINTDKGYHKSVSTEQNYQQIRICFAIFLILARCKHMVCCNNAGSLWMVLCRRKTKHVHQWLNNKWV